VVKSLVQAHGGTVSADSAGKGQGATFVVRLPMSASEDMDEHAAPEVSRPTPRDGSLAGISVLVVDDDRSTREVLAEYLSSNGATVHAAPSAVQGLTELEHQHVDVLLADIGMPGEDGYTFIGKVRALGGKIGAVPAVALTAFARDEDRRLALQAGFQLHLTKPIDPPALIATIAALHGGPATAHGGIGASRNRRPDVAADPIHL
ncbi:MAG: response regulator, partial [Acidobacteriota bacterium]